MPYIVNVTLNVSDPLSAGDPEGRRARLTEDLANALAAWNFREVLLMFRRLHRGAVSLIHLNVLMLLETEGPLSMGALAEQLDVSVASATGIVSRMEARGMVQRHHDTGDRRVVLVRQTDAGAAVFVELDSMRREGIRQILTQLTEDELAGFLVGYRALHAARTAYAATREPSS